MELALAFNCRVLVFPTALLTGLSQLFWHDKCMPSNIKSRATHPVCLVVLFSQETTDRASRTGLKLHPGALRLDIRNNFFTEN